MKKLSSMLMNFVKWIATIFFAISVIMYFPSLASVLCFLLVILIIPIKRIQNFLSEKLRRKWIKPVLVLLLFLATVSAIPDYDATTSEAPESIAEEKIDTEEQPVIIDEEEPITSADEVTIEETWRNQFSDELVSDIEQAFKEIGENADNITYIEYVGVRETALFDRRDYKVEFDRGNFIDVLDEDERPWRHSRWYRITTEEWHEGEPEREQFPREYLVTIKFWTDDNTTNINQWTYSSGSMMEVSDAERLGVSEKELSEIERVMELAGWDYSSKDFERIYRLKDSEMTLNPANFVEYEVSIIDGPTQRVTINRNLIE